MFYDTLPTIDRTRLRNTLETVTIDNDYDDDDNHNSVVASLVSESVLC